MKIVRRSSLAYARATRYMAFRELYLISLPSPLFNNLSHVHATYFILQIL